MPTLEETDHRFYVRESTIPGAGRGLFARQPLGVGDRLEVIGCFVASGSTADFCTEYADQHKFRVGEKLLLPFGYGGMANHSLQGNMEKVIEGDRLYLQVTRPVAIDEELFFTYSEYAQARFGLRDGTDEGG